MDDLLRVSIYNYLHDAILDSWYDDDGRSQGEGKDLAKLIWTDYWHQSADIFKTAPYEFLPWLKKFILEDDWNLTYDLIEFALSNSPMIVNPARINKILEREMSGYRLRDKLIVPISDPTELAAIDETLGISDRFNSARLHIVSALDKLSQKPAPDLRNAITEAVSAVESAARIITGQSKATLADALKLLGQRGHVHPALKGAWEKLYGYTSDEHGLRHAMTEDPNIDFPTAKYMVVSCAAFVNLLSAVQLKK